MRPIRRGVIVGWVVLATWCASAGADGGTLRIAGKQSGYQIAVFTDPTPFRAGAVDISALVQDVATGDPMPQVKVTVCMTQSGRGTLEYPATPGAATNKLFHAAQFRLPEPGLWEMQIRVEGPRGLAVLAGPVEAAVALPRWREIWPWVGWPALVIALFGMHQVLVHRADRPAIKRGEDDHDRLHA
jgi:hypothetical protein